MKKRFVYLSPGQKVSLNLSIHELDERIHALRRKEKNQPVKNAQLRFGMVVFASFIRNCSHHGIHGCSSSIMLFYMCGILLLILRVKEAVDSLRLHGGVSVARNDWGAKSSIGPMTKPCGIPLITYRLSRLLCYYVLLFMHVIFF